jgi:hypothetical protein
MHQVSDPDVPTHVLPVLCESSTLCGAYGIFLSIYDDFNPKFLVHKKISQWSRIKHTHTGVDDTSAKDDSRLAPTGD